MSQGMIQTAVFRLSLGLGFRLALVLVLGFGLSMFFFLRLNNLTHDSLTY